MPDNVALSSNFWRIRAEEARTLADGMNFGDTRKAMLRIATSYERLADAALAAERGKGNPKEIP